jgi:hypothetical protein
MFRMIGMCDQHHFKDNAQKILNKEISLKSYLGNVVKQNKVQKKKVKAKEVITEVIALAGVTECDDFNQVEKMYPGKFDEEVIQSFLGADVGQKTGNLKGELLEHYCKKVTVAKKTGITNQLPPDFDCQEIEDINTISDDALKEFDDFVVNSDCLVGGVAMRVIDTVLSSETPKVALLLFENEPDHLKAARYIYSKSLPDGLIKMQVFFEVKKPLIVGHIAHNLLYGTLVGKFVVCDPPLCVFNRDVKTDLKKLILQFNTVRAQVGYFSLGKREIVNVHSKEMSVLYFGNKEAIAKFLDDPSNVTKEPLLKSEDPYQFD